MQTTVVSAMVSHTVGWASVFCALPGDEEGSEASQSRRVPVPRPASPASPIYILPAPQTLISKLDSSSELSPERSDLCLEPPSSWDISVTDISFHVARSQINDGTSHPGLPSSGNVPSLSCAQ